MADDPKEIMSQEDIDAYIASVRAEEGRQERETLAQNSQEQPSTDDTSDDPKEIMTQEEIDAYIASVKARERTENQEKEAQQQGEAGAKLDDSSNADENGVMSQSVPETSIAQQQKHEPDTPQPEEGEPNAVSQDDIDAMTAQQQEHESETPQPEEGGSGAVSQGDIDALIARQQESLQSEQGETGTLSQGDIDALIARQQEQDAQASLSDQNDFGTVSQDDIDALTTREPMQGQENSAEEILQQELDTIFAQRQSEAAVDETQDVWEELDHDILSQDEIDALLNGFHEEYPPAASSVDTAVAEQKIEPAGLVDDITVISRRNHIERQRRKEENFIREKQRASALIRELLRMEEKRVSSTLAKKDELVSDDLYARYEITRADRTKLIVSMSEKTAEEYMQVHPGCYIYRI